MKIGRNDPCICGSGKKYKQCCLNNTKPPKGILRRALNFGSTDPFAARIIFQMCKIRNLVYVNNDDIKAFDETYNPVMQNLLEAKTVKDKCIDLIKEYNTKIKLNKIAVLNNNGVINVDEIIDVDLNILFKDFFIRGKMAINGLVDFIKYIGYDIDFVFKKDSVFVNGAEKFLLENPSDGFKRLISFISENRGKWYSSFIKLRNDIEHRGFRLPDIEYWLNGDDIVAVYPAFKVGDDYLNIEKFLNLLWNNLFNLCEDLSVFFVALKLPASLSIKLIPKQNRAPNMPIKYEVVFVDRIQK